MFSKISTVLKNTVLSSNSLKIIEEALEYIEEQEKRTAAEKLMLQHWRYTSAKTSNQKYDAENK